MPVGLSVLFAFAAMLGWGIGDFLIQRSTRKIGNIESLAIVGAFGSIALLPFALQELSLVFSGILILFILGFVNFFVSVLNFEALKQGKLSVIDTVLEIELPLTVFLGIVFFAETLSPAQFFLVFIIFFGILLPHKKTRSHTVQTNKRCFRKRIQALQKKRLGLKAKNPASQTWQIFESVICSKSFCF